MSAHIGNDAVIVAARRTPVGIGKADRGALAGEHPVDLSAHVLKALVDDLGVDPGTIDDIQWGCVSQVGEQSFNVGRNAALAAGFPESVVGTTVDRQCGSSQQAIHNAAAMLIAGHADVVVAGGVESMSRVPMFSNTVGGDGPFGPSMRTRYPELVSQGVSAEMIAARWGLTRERLDRLAVGSTAARRPPRKRGCSTRRSWPLPGRTVRYVTIRESGPEPHWTALRSCRRRSRRTG